MSDPAIAMVESQAKSFLLSKTFWANLVVTPLALWLASHNLVLDATTQAQLCLVFILVMNLVLRKVTHAAVTMTLPGTKTPPATPIASLLGGVALMGLAVSVTACSSAQVSLATAQSVYALGGSLSTAETLALAFETSPLATPSSIAQIKALDNGAYKAISPLVANANNVSADQVAVASAALGALTTYLAGAHK